MEKKFGKKIKTLSGFAECLKRESFKDVSFTSGHTSEVLYAKVCNEVGLFIAEESRWGFRGGLGKQTIVGVYRNGKVLKQKLQYIDQFDVRRDRPGLQIERLEVETIRYESLDVKAYHKNGETTTLHFPIAGSESEKSEKQKELDLAIENCKEELLKKYAGKFPALELKTKVDYSCLRATFVVVLDPANPRELSDPLREGFLTEYKLIIT